MKRYLLMAAALIGLLLMTVPAMAETLTMSLIGDCTVGDQWKVHGYTSSMTYKVGQWGMDWPFSLAADLFANDDITIANCEGVLTDRYPASNAKYMTLGAPVSFGQAFQLGNIDVCNLANNHSKDFGAAGLQDTADTLQSLGIGVFYDEVLYETEIKGVKLGIVGFTYPINKAKLERYRLGIQQLREDGCTFIIASCHWGKEESLSLTQDQLEGGPQLIDMGADMVYGHGSHTVQPIQIYNGHLIFYSLSNFTFGANPDPKDDDTVVVQVVFDINNDGTMTPAELFAYPYAMHNQCDYRPWPYTLQEDCERVWRKLVTKKRPVEFNVPESFLTSGYLDLRSWLRDGVDTNADSAYHAIPVIEHVSEWERQQGIRPELPVPVPSPAPAITAAPTAAPIPVVTPLPTGIPAVTPQPLEASDTLQPTAVPTPECTPAPTPTSTPRQVGVHVQK